MRAFLALGFALIAGAAAAEPARIVSLGGDVTEIVYALGEEGRLVGVDQTSMHPLAARALPQIGYVRMLSAEGTLSLTPDLAIAAHAAGPPAVLEQLRDAGVVLVQIPDAQSIDGVYAKIDAVAKALGAETNALALKSSIAARMTRIEAALARVTDRPKAVFLMAQGPGGAMAAGAGSAADAMLRLAGAENVAGAFEGYKPLTAESAVALAPDVIVIADHAAAMMGGVDALRSRPEIALTPAGQNGRIVAMDALLLLGFGPRTPEAIVTLAKALHPGLVIETAALEP